MGIEPISSDEMEQASAAALCRILRDSSLWEVIRVVYSVRWGKIGRAIEEKRRVGRKTRCFSCNQPAVIGVGGMLMHPTENRSHDCGENWRAEHGYESPAIPSPTREDHSNG